MLNYKLVLICLSALLTVVLICKLAGNRSAQSPALAARPGSPPKLIVVSFDGFRYDYLGPRLSPRMYQIATEKGVTGHMLPTFCTKTFPNHHSISTGLYQETHGIVHNCMYDPLFDQVFADKEDGRSDRWWDNQIATPIYVANQLYGQNRASCCSPWIGCHVRYFGQHRALYHRHYNKSDQWREQFEWSMQRMHHPVRPANLVMMYVPEPDGAAHFYGPFGNHTLNQVAQIDQFVGYLEARLHELNLSNSTNVILLSDHGISEISDKRSVALDSFLNSSLYDVYGCNPVLHVRPRPGFEREVRQILRTRQRELPFTVYEKSEIPSRFRYRNNRRIHDLLLVAYEGWSLYRNRHEMNLARHHRGQHGYDNLEYSMRPLFMAFGPAFRKAFRQRTPFTNVDLYPLMLHLLGIKADFYYNQGNLNNVAAMLRVNPESTS